ncbi:glycosyltransferase [Shimia sp. NS0008-38b]|uniref:glycosyltransferase family 2 protein n=1 Tax=Shimia sp. NS0008-38b TaxID=3127653 RepID=UPI00310935A3
MTNARLHRLPEPSLPRRSARLPLARVLIEQNLVTPWQIFYALRCQSVWDTTLPDILTARGWLSEGHMRDMLARRNGMQRVDLKRTPPAQEVSDLLPPAYCLQYNVLPWAQLGGQNILVTGRPHQLDRLQASLPHTLKSAHIAVADPQDVEAHITLHRRRTLTDLAETTVPEILSCRSLAAAPRQRNLRLAFLLIALSSLCVLLPNLVLALVTLWTMLTLTAATGLRVAAFVLRLRTQVRAKTMSTPPPDFNITGSITALPAKLSASGHRTKLPQISIMVPLFRETEIASALIQRLTRLTYPRALLDLVLVLEEKDQLTRDTVARTRLPRWMRVIEVPAGSGITTKPRALNYALPFCRGDIIGIWDAEDAPAPDQLERVAHHFAQAAPEVACIQGALDFYNPYTNWLSRCFAIEYGSWFRLILPGLLGLGFAIPLGGTTLFLKRGAIESVGAWDSHNVTEDADLGIRLARHGYRTELLDSVTYEEANCRPIAWVRQRSRWLKGYMATYLVHMRTPRILWRELGVRQFLGFQLLFLCTISQFLMAPLLWLLWVTAFGLPSPLATTFSPPALTVISSLLLLAGISNGAVWIAAITQIDRPPLYKWTLSMVFYFPLATLAAYKGLIEMVVAPFYWDKTSHGKTTEGVAHGVTNKLTSNDNQNAA